VHRSAITGKNNSEVALRYVQGQEVQFDVVSCVGEKSNRAVKVTGLDGEPVKGSRRKRRSRANRRGRSNPSGMLKFRNSKVSHNIPRLPTHVAQSVLFCVREHHEQGRRRCHKDW